MYFFLVNLYSKDDKAREEAADGCKKLANKINNPNAIESLLKYLFGVLNGSEGKLTVIDHKISVLQVCLNLNYIYVYIEILILILNVRVQEI